MRVVEALRACDAIFCEDTRHSLTLLNHLGVKKPLTSCHEHNERAAAEKLCALLERGEHVCYLSDAGMPGISDPGAILVQTCIARGYEYEVLPGASALPMAAVLSGLPCERFSFFGFLPRSGGARKRALDEIAQCRHLVLLYESPHRVRDTLVDLRARLGECDAALLRELTKKFETHERGTLTELIARFAEEPKGECVLAVYNAPKAAPAGEEALDAALRGALDAGLSVKDAAAEAAEALHVPKKRAYARALELKEE